MRKLVTFLLLLSLSLALCAQGIGNMAELKAFIEAANKGESLLPWCSADSVGLNYSKGSYVVSIILGNIRRMPIKAEQD